MSKKDLQKLKKDELVAMAADRGIAPDGTKTKLIERLLSAAQPPSPAEADVSPPPEPPPVHSDEPPEPPPPSSATGPRGLTAVKAVPVTCPRCGEHRRKIVRSTKCIKKGAWFQGRWIVGVVEQTADCVRCSHRYRVTDVIKTGEPEEAPTEL